MIAALIRWSARNVFLIGLATIFVTLAGIYAVSRVPLDAIPDLSDVQVIVYTEYSGQAPQVVEDQVTYPLTTAMLSVPKSRVVRGFSFFGVSFVYVIFEDGTDLYWARSRVLEYLSSAARRLPAGVAPSLGPDATGVGWVYQYVVHGAQKSLAELRTIQDWYVRYGIAKAEGVAEVASVGGFVKQYSVVIDPRRLQALGIPLAKIREALRTSNMDVGGRTVELAETEFAVRGRGYIKSLSDLEQIVVKDERGVPVLLKDVARIELTPDERRGITEMNGEGEVVSGIVLQRFGENALSVIRNVKDRLAEIAPSLPPGVSIESVYDRSDLIYRAIDTLKRTLIEESAIVALVCVVFLLHVRSALVAVITLPIGVLIAYLCMYLLGLSSNIMSLGGIAIAIGAMVDAAIVMIENAHKHLERAPPDRPRAHIIVNAASEVGPALFFSLLVITVSFLPIFALEAQEGRLFKPLAYTKTFAMAAAALLSVTLVPALMILFVRGRIIPEHKNPVNRFLIWLYRPAIRVALRFKAATILAAVAILAVSLWPAMKLGSEFMPNLNEGTLFYMPTTLPGLSVTKAAELVQTQDKIIKSFPEVASVWGKAGRASTATDPAPTEMFETVINLKPESEWRPGMKVDKLIAEMDRSLQFPGVSNAWTMPIKARIDMLFRRVTETLIVMLSVPFALVGGLWLMWWLGFNLSVAVAVGFIALAGVAAETGVVMLIYLDHAYAELQEQRAMDGRPFTREDLYTAIMAGAVERVRPKMMTVCAIMAGLLPIMWSHGTGAEVMQRIAVPMIGGMVSSTLLTLIVIPAIYAVVKGIAIRLPRLAPAFERT
jgi:copper/silver efflux system protein